MRRNRAFRIRLTCVAGLALMIPSPCSRIAHNSLQAMPPEGALIRVAPNGDREIIVDGLFFPGGLALGKNDELYVTNCGICFDDGEVLRITQ